MSSWEISTTTTVRYHGGTTQVGDRYFGPEKMGSSGLRRAKQIAKRHFVRSVEYAQVDERADTRVSFKKPGAEEKIILQKTKIYSY